MLLDKKKKVVLGLSSVYYMILVGIQTHINIYQHSGKNFPIIFFNILSSELNCNFLIFSFKIQIFKNFFS